MRVPKAGEVGKGKGRREDEGHSLSLRRLKNRKRYLSRQYVGNCRRKIDVDCLGEP